MNTIRDHLESVRAQIAAAEAAAGRPAGSVRLLAVSKTFPAEDVAAAFACGQTCFGENRVQELASKVPALPDTIEWHLIGSLQSNKAAKAAALASWIHSVDSEKLVRKISAAASTSSPRNTPALKRRFRTSERNIRRLRGEGMARSPSS